MPFRCIISSTNNEHYRMMKNLSTILFALVTTLCPSSNAFQPNPLPRFHSKTALFALSTATDAKQNLIDVAEGLKAKEGVLLVDSKAKADLKKAVAELEAVANPPTNEDYETKYKGDWTLVCSTSTNADGIDLSKIPFLNEGPIKNIRDAINRCLVVKQRIRAMGDSGAIDRVDHVLEYQPPDSLTEILDNLPDALASLDINPLHVSEGKVTLVHKADVESVTPVLRTKLSLESIILSIAGESQYLEPSGMDLVGFNVPLGEFLNSGSFDTTYLDDDIRISRGKLGLVEQLRVFVRSDKQEALVLEDAEAPTPLGENAGEVIVGGAEDETEEAVDVDMISDETPSDVEEEEGEI